MELFIYSLAIFSAAILTFFLIERPYYLGGIIIFMLLYQFNIETPFILDARGLLTLLLFIRLYFFDKDNMFLIHHDLLKNRIFWFIIVFILLIIIAPVINSERTLRYFKEIILAIINIILGFVLVKTEEGRKSLVLGVLLASTLSAIDLLFTFSTTGSLHIIKLVDLIIGRKLVLLNHNYPGLLSSMGLIILYFALYRTNVKTIFIILLSGFLFLGVIISTSRSTLLAILVVLFLASIFEVDMKHNLKKIIPIGAIISIFLIGFFFVYNVFYTKSTRDSYIDKIYYRLYEEPMDMLSGKELNMFDKYSGQRVEGSMKFRSRRWQRDLDKFTELSVFKQILGLGPKGYLKIAEKVYGHSGFFKNQLASHNGYLLILMERGYLGLGLIILIFFSLSITAIKTTQGTDIIFPMIYLLLLLIFYSFAQNSELTSAYTFLILGTVLGNIIHTKLENEDEELNYEFIDALD